MTVSGFRIKTGTKLSRTPTVMEGTLKLSFGDAAVGEVDQLVAAGAHLDVYVLERRALEFQARGLMMVGTAEVAEF